VRLSGERGDSQPYEAISGESERGEGQVKNGEKRVFLNADSQSLTLRVGGQ
jgi:hypothetical protein